MNWNKNIVIAHRGAWKKNNLPENSIASLKEAIRLKCYGSEFDVHFTKDSVIVVNHDDVFKGMTIASSTHAELQQRKRSVNCAASLKFCFSRFASENYTNHERKSISTIGNVRSRKRVAT